MENIIENNQVELSGRIITQFEFDHEIFGEGFYKATLEVVRTSNTPDDIPIMVSERIVDVKADWLGQLVKVFGQFRSYNKHEETRNRLILSVFVREMEVWQDDGDGAPVDENNVILEGFVCKEPVYRKTPLGREIADILLAVNRPYGKSDYIPCILWGRNARYVEKIGVGDKISMHGRIQSRKYTKSISDEEYEIRTAYEVSVVKMDVKPKDK